MITAFKNTIGIFLLATVCLLPAVGVSQGLQNASFGVPDTGATAVFADRKGFSYNGKILPDIIVNENGNTEQDEILQAAVKWLKEI